MLPEKMLAFNDNSAFSLNDKERNYIVSVIQYEISKLSQIKTFPCPQDAIANHKRIMELMQVIETFHVEKIWTAQEQALPSEN